MFLKLKLIVVDLYTFTFLKIKINSVMIVLTKKRCLPD